LQIHNQSRATGRWFGIAGILFLLLSLLTHPASATDTPTSATTAEPGSATASFSGADPAGEAPAGEQWVTIGDETLLLDVRMNGNSIGKIGEFVMRHGTLMARPSELRDLGLRIPDSLILGSHELIALSDVGGLSFSLDEKNLTIDMKASDSLLLPTVLETFGQQSALTRRDIESGTGMTLNYDTLGTFSSGTAGATGSLDFRAFSPWGVGSSTVLGYAGANPVGTGAAKAVRLDSAYTFADVNSLRRYSLGDYITSGLSWTRPIRLEGVQVRSDFSMRPDLVTFPLPTIKGSTAVPSTVEVLADGNIAASSHVGAGPFQVPQLPVVSGAGTISMTVTDALGQQVTTSQPFYASSSLLAPGLQSFAVQSGLVRRRWGVASNDYGKIAGATIYRRGLTPTFTMEGTAEGTPGTVLAGAGGVKQIGHLGVVNFAAAGSAGWGYSGGQISVGAQRIGRTFSLGGSGILATRGHRDVAAMNGDGILRKQISAFTGLNLRHFGSVGAAYAKLDRETISTQFTPDFVAAQQSQVFSANYSFQFRHASFYASEFKDFSQSGSSGFQVGITIPIGKRDSVSVGGMSDGNVQLQAQRSAVKVGDWGYNGFVSAGDSSHAFGQVQYKSPVGLFTAGADESGGVTSARLEAQGAVSFTDRALFPSNTIYDSFAIVDTGVVPHVHVLQENRNVGRTNSSGRLLVPDMRAFDLNHLSITATDIPADVTLDTDTREIRPQDRSGVVVRFPVKESHSALLKLVDEAGRPLELGSVATLHATGADAPIGYDGDAYIADLGPHNELSVERKDGRRCTANFDFKPVPGDIPSIGPLRCLEIKP
jgi:outer membrane usher protein